MIVVVMCATLLAVTEQDLEAKNALPTFIHHYLCLAIPFLWPHGVGFNQESVRGYWPFWEIKLLEQRVSDFTKDHHLLMSRQRTECILSLPSFIKYIQLKMSTCSVMHHTFLTILTQGRQHPCYGNKPSNLEENLQVQWKRLQWY